MQDTIIIGGGPAASATSCYLSRAGIKNTIIESQNHPRAHVGESMVTSTTRIFDELDFLPIMEREGFVRKYGASWHPPKADGHLAIEFAEFPQPGVNQDYTYHVDRAKFDLLWLKHAEDFGANLIQGVQVKEVLFEDDYANGVRIDIGGQQVDIPCKMVVDASGRSTLLGRQLGWKQSDADFNQFAVHAWFKNVDKSKRPDDIHVHFLPVERGWVWQIPISEEITSMGVVAEKRVFKEGKGDFAAWFEELSNSAPDIKRAMQNAERINDFEVEADYSYCMNSFVGNGFCMVGDAARFVDPIFSSGVSVALSSAKFASERIIRAFKEQDFSESMLKPYEEKLKRGTTIWYEFIKLYYKLLPLFTVFIESKDHRQQVLQLLQGEVYDRQEVPVLDEMRKFIKAVETNDKHVLRGALDRSLNL